MVVRKVWLTTAFVAQLQVAAAPLASPRSCADSQVVHQLGWRQVCRVRSCHLLCGAKITTGTAMPKAALVYEVLDTAPTDMW